MAQYFIPKPPFFWDYWAISLDCIPKNVKVSYLIDLTSREELWMESSLELSAG
jgi:hypothetical protein